MSGNRNDKLLKRLGKVAFIDNSNSTTTPLAANGVFTGEWTHALHYNTVKVAIKSDQTGTLVFQQSTQRNDDVENLMQNANLIVYAAPGTGSLASSKLYLPWFRIIYTNDAVAQTYLTISAIPKAFE